MAKTHGTKGELRITTDTGVTFTEWAFLEIREKPVPFHVLRCQPAGNGEYIVAFEDIDTLEKAQRYTGLTVLLPRTKGRRGPRAAAFDLNGFMLVDARAGEIGRIAGIEELPQQTMFITHYKEQQIMIPMVEEFITGVDEKKEIIYLDLPEGFFGLYE